MLRQTSSGQQNHNKGDKMKLKLYKVISQKTVTEGYDSIVIWASEENEALKIAIDVSDNFDVSIIDEVKEPAFSCVMHANYIHKNDSI
jgi:hypothetical protein